MLTYDLLVIGAGSGGVRASRLASTLGKKVALIEDDRVGGTCVNRGCVPKKLLVYASEYSDAFSQSRGFGWRFADSPQFDWTYFINEKDRELTRLQEIYKSNLRKANVDLFAASASFVNNHVVKLSTGEQLRAENIIIATGSRPNRPADIVGVEHCITSRELFFLKKQPRSIILCGGGYTAVEFANIFHGLGSQVTLIHRNDLFLRNFDYDLRQRLNDAMEEKFKIYHNNHISKVLLEGEQKKVILKDGTKLEADEILLCLGRKPYNINLNLSNAGVETGLGGEIKVDEYLATSQSHIYAIGDVRGSIQLAPVAIEDAVCVIKTLYHNIKTKPDYENIATAVFSQPEIAKVGLCEEEAKQAYKTLDVYCMDFKPMKHTISGSTQRIFMKMLVDRITDHVIGVHLLGPSSAELIQIIAVALKARVKKIEFDKTIAVHPTAAEELVLCYNPSYSYYNGIRQEQAT